MLHRTLTPPIRVGYAAQVNLSRCRCSEKAHVGGVNSPNLYRSLLLRETPGHESFDKDALDNSLSSSHKVLPSLFFPYAVGY